MLKKIYKSQIFTYLPVTPSFRDPWLNRGEGARGDREEPEGGTKRP